MDVHNKDKFGLFHLGIYAFPDRYSQSMEGETVFYCIRDSDQYNFMGEQITLKPQLNPDVWDAYVQDYWDKQLPLLIRFGFPIDYGLENQEDNHTSAKSFPEDIKAYVDEEISHGAILDPFASRPVDNLHESPMMNTEKPNTPHRRVIID